MSALGNKEILAKNLNYYLELFNKKNIDVCKDLGFKESTFSDWCNANAYPRIDKIEKLANYFGIQKRFLIEEQNATSELDEYLKILKNKPALKSLIDVSKDISEDDLLTLITLAQRLK